MRVAFVQPFSEEVAFIGTFERQYLCSDAFFREIVCNWDAHKHRYVKALMLYGIAPDFYVLSHFRTIRRYRHKYGHVIIRVPVDLGLMRHGFEYSLTLLRLLKRERPDVVVLAGSYYVNPLVPDMWDLTALYCAKMGTPFISMLGGGSWWRQLPGRRWVKALALRYSSWVICNRADEAAVLRDVVGVDAERIIYMDRPIDTEVLYEVPKEEAARELGMDSGHDYVLYVGRLHREKGVHVLVRAMSLVVEERPGAKLIIIGFGPEVRGLRELVAHEGLEEHVIMVLKPVFHETLRLYYNLADVVVLPSFSEGKPNVLLEALACNTPCVGTNVGGIPELLAGGCGVVVPPGDEKALAEAILRVLEGGFKINQARRERLLRSCSLKAVGAVMKRLCELVLEENGEGCSHGGLKRS